MSIAGYRKPKGSNPLRGKIRALFKCHPFIHVIFVWYRGSGFCEVTALQGAMAEFRPPPKGHIPVATVAEARNQTEEAVIKLVIARRGRVEYFYTLDNE